MELPQPTTHIIVIFIIFLGNQNVFHNVASFQGPEICSNTHWYTLSLISCDITYRIVANPFRSFTLLVLGKLEGWNFCNSVCPHMLTLTENHAWVLCTVSLWWHEKETKYFGSSKPNCHCSSKSGYLSLEKALVIQICHCNNEMKHVTWTHLNQTPLNFSVIM